MPMDPLRSVIYLLFNIRYIVSSLIKAQHSSPTRSKLAALIAVVTFIDNVATGQDDRWNFKSATVLSKAFRWQQHAC